jgi:hypothetical protein
LSLAAPIAAAAAASVAEDEEEDASCSQLLAPSSRRHTSAVREAALPGKTERATACATATLTSWSLTTVELSCLPPLPPPNTAEKNPLTLSGSGGFRSSAVMTSSYHHIIISSYHHIIMP